MNGDSVQTHSVFISDRKRAELTGISEVESFNDTEIDLVSQCGSIAIEGEQLKIDSFSVESGKILIEGQITGIFYYEKQPSASSARGGLFSRRRNK